MHLALTTVAGVKLHLLRLETYQSLFAHPLERSFHIINDVVIEPVHGGRCLIHCYAGFESCEKVCPVLRAVFKTVKARPCETHHRYGQEYLCCGSNGGALEIFRGDADDRHRLSIDGESLIENAWILGEALPPIVVTQNNNMWLIDGSIIGLGQQSAQSRLQTQHRKVAARHDESPAVLGLPTICKVRAGKDMGSNAGEDILVPFKITEHGVAEYRLAAPNISARRTALFRAWGREVYQTVRLDNG